MALTFPRDLPSAMPFRAVAFAPSYQQVTAPTRGGLVQVANIGADLWVAKYETPPLSRTASLEWRAWLHSLRGGARTFKAWDPVRRWAAAYRSGYGGLVVAGGATPFTGAANLLAIASNRASITLDGLPAAFVVGAGDLLSYASGNAQILHEVTEGGTASDLGVVTVTIEPTVPLGVVTGVAVSLEAPWFEAVIDAKSVGTLPWQLGQRTTFSFQATQIFRL